MNPRFAKLPGYAEASRLQELRRDSAFLMPPLVLCGVECCHLTPHRLAVLMVSQSPFVCGGVPMPEHISQFLWALQSQFAYGKNAERDAFTQEKTAHLKYEDAVKAIYEYVDEVFMDAPATDGTQQESSFSWLATIVDALASEYGWTQDYVLDLPLACVFQYLRTIERRHNPKALQFNRLTDKVTSDLFKRMNSPKEAPAK